MGFRLRGAAHRSAAVLLGVVGTLVLIEMGGWLFLQIRPSYEVVFLDPDRTVGWKLVPEYRFTWTGVHWYAADFSVDVSTNSLGFRDKERSVERPKEVVRVALLGDSFIEALQVPLEQTAGQRLEANLDRHAAAADSTGRYEVLNFGVSSHGLGQALLVWEAYARRFRPNYVFVFVTEFLMHRTVQPFEAGAFQSSRSRRLWVRPTFRVEHGELVRQPARDFDAFVRAQEDLLRARFRGGRSRKREQSLFGRWMRSRPSIPSVRAASVPAARAERRSRVGSKGPSQSNLLEVNLAVLEELGRSARSADAQLVIVDATGIFSSGIAGVHQGLVRLSAQEGFGYVSAYQAFAQAQRSGQSVRWEHDPHLNQLGNEILARELLRWMAEHADRRPGPRVSQGPGQGRER